MHDNTVKASKGSLSARRRAARLMAAQAVYQMLSDPVRDAADVVAEYLAHRAGMDVDGERMVPPDTELFRTLAGGAIEARAELEALILAGRQAGGKAAERALEPLLQAILLCGAYELRFCPETDFPIVLSDYTDVAHSFYEKNEAGLVNAVLDAVRRAVRSDSI